MNLLDTSDSEKLKNLDALAVHVLANFSVRDIKRFATRLIDDATLGIVGDVALQVAFAEFEEERGII